MLIDSTHRKWMVGTLIGLGAGTAIYIPYTLAAPHGATGGSVIGLAYGVVGFGCMVFAGLLSLRKKFPVWRVGRAQTWMRGHIWLSMLSFPLILFHAGFEFGGPLTQVLMWLYIIVMVTGILGGVLQHYLPRLMMEQLPLETVFEQIKHVEEQLVAEADKLLENELQPRTLEAVVMGVAHRSQSALAVEPELLEKDAHQVREVYNRAIRPYLMGERQGRSVLGESGRAAAVFQQLRTLVSPGVHDAVADLESICDEKRQLDQQKRMHYALHGWQLVHAPLSLALLSLAAIHAVVSLMY